MTERASVMGVGGGWGWGTGVTLPSTLIAGRKVGGDEEVAAIAPDHPSEVVDEFRRLSRSIRAIFLLRKMLGPAATSA